MLEIDLEPALEQPGESQPHLPVVSVDAIPVAINPIAPRYQSGSDVATDGGKVTLRLLIDATGVVRDAVVVEAQPVDVFEESTRIALTSVRFKPAEKGGKAVGCQTLMSIVYAKSHLSAVTQR